jgi:hypothetical protein
VNINVFAPKRNDIRDRVQKFVIVTDDPVEQAALATAYQHFKKTGDVALDLKAYVWSAEDTNRVLA